jgi:hypothetical protein
VEYEAGLQIRIPLDATNLRYSPPPGKPLKVNWPSLQEFLAFAQEWGTPCPSPPAKFGKDCQRVSSRKSVRK